jgi:hypothetical protein
MCLRRYRIERRISTIREMLGIAEGVLQDLHNDHSEVADLLGKIMDSEVVWTYPAVRRDEE